MRNKRFFTVLILVLMMLAVVLVGCTPNLPTPETPGESGKTEADMERVLKAVKDTLTNSQKKSETEMIYSVKSSYSIDIAKFKFTLTLDANFNETNPADSTIYFKLFDDEYNGNRLMAFYSAGTLLLDTLGERTEYANFGASAFFSLFYEATRLMDLSKLLLSPGIIEMIGDFILFKPFVSPENIIERKVGESGNYYEIKDVNLDSVKATPNELLKSMFAPIGDKLDALTVPVLGLPFSELSNIQIGTWTADQVYVASENNLLREFGFGFNGYLDSREAYNLQGKLELGFTERTIVLMPDDNPGAPGEADPEGPQLPYKKGNLDEFSYVGTLSFGGNGQMMMKTTYDLEVLLKSDSNNNGNNKMSILLRSQGSDKVAASVFYKEGKLYADLGDIMELLGNGFGLTEMGFPKARIDSFNMSQTFGTMIAQLEKMITDAITGVGGGTIDTPTRDMLLKKISSDKSGYLNLQVDKELLTFLGGGETNVITYIANMLGMDTATVERYFKSEIFDRFTATVKVNVGTRNIIVILNDGKNDILTLNLRPKEFDETLLDSNFTRYGSDLEAYSPFATPNEIGVVAEGSISTSQLADFSKFFGAFIGDCYGKNTPIILSGGGPNGTSLNFKVDAISDMTGSYRIHAKIWTGTQTVLELWGMDENGIPMLYVDFNYLNLKYKIAAEEVKKALALALGENNILINGDIIEILAKVLDVAQVHLQRDFLALTINKHAESDPLNEIFGIKGLSANFTIAVKYTFEDSLFVPAGKDNYIVPELDTISARTFNSLYDAEWWEKIKVINLDMDMYIPYDPESIKIIDGKSFYSPVGRLFGKEIRYTLLLEDTVNGTKEVVGVKNNGEIVIDPWAVVPLKDTMDVQYIDGEGKLPYRIEDFDPSLISVQGMDRKKFNIHFGTGTSILNKTLTVEITVEVRTLDVTSTRYQKVGDYTIVGEKQINPLAFFENPTEFLPTDVKLYFKNIRPDGGNATYEDTFQMEWDYEYDKNVVTVGSVQLATLRLLRKDGSAEEFVTQKFAYRIIVLTKQFDSIRIMTEQGTGSYTVDVLSKATYAIPKISTEKQEIRLYFTDGTYSTVGDKVRFEPDINRNSYLPSDIAWKYQEVAVIASQGSSMPFGNTDKDTADYPLALEYKGYHISLGTFKLVLTVSEPASSLIKGGSIFGVVDNPVDTNGILGDRQRGNFDYHKIDLGFGLGRAFDFNPYDRKNLPSNITVAINSATVQGDYNEVLHAYPVQWSTSGNIISADGRILYPSANDMNFQVKGTIGDGTITHEISCVVHNIESKYESVEYFRKDANGKLVAMDANSITTTAYTPYLLPTHLKLKLGNGDIREVDNIQWNWRGNGQTIKTWSVEMYNAYFAYLNDAIGDFNILDKYKNPQPNDGIGHRFDNESGSFDIAVSVSTAEGGLYENDIPYQIKVLKTMNAWVKSPLGDPTPDGKGVIIDPYSANAKTLASRFITEYPIAKVQFSEAGTPYFYPVTWEPESVSVLLARLKSGDDETPIETRGTIFAGIAGMEQSITGIVVVMNRTVSKEEGILFDALNAESPSKVISKITNDGTEKVMKLTLNKPYLLTLNGKYATPYDYVSEILKNVRLVFATGDSRTYTTKIDFYGKNKDSFNSEVLNFADNVASTTVSFFVGFSSEGSTTDGMVVVMETLSDILQTLSISESINRFTADGQPKYADGYYLQKEVKVTFSKSGEIIVPVNRWVVDEVASDSTLVKGSVISGIPVSEFQGWNSRSIRLSAELELSMVVIGDGEGIRNTVQVRYTYNIVSTTIGQTSYSASSNYVHNGQDYQLNIENGLITFQSIFDYYGFLNAGGKYDKAKLPTTITPTRSGAYEQDNTFAVSWVMNAPPANFDDFYGEGVLAATAVVKGYGQSTQNINLRIRIAKKSATSVTAEGYDFVTEGNQVSLSIDPYKKANGYSMWETMLPTHVTVSMVDASKNVTTSVSSVTYSYKNDGVPLKNLKLLYNYHAFEDVKAGGDNRDVLQLVMKMEDGTTFDLTVKLLNRTVESVLLPYGTTEVIDRGGVISHGIGYTQNLYYIDPYDTSFTSLPTSAKVNFVGGVQETLDFVLTAAGDPYRMSYEGGTYRYEFKLFGYRSGTDGYEQVQDPQIVAVDVIVVSRLFRGGASATVTSVNFKDGIAAMLSDITSGKNLTGESFINGSHPVDMRLQVPSLTKWYVGGRLATDADFVPGMDIVMKGQLSDRAAGETFTANVSAWSLTYNGIGTMVGGAFVPEERGIVYNVFNAESVRKDYTIWFSAVDSKAEVPTVEDYYLDFATTEGGDQKHRIVWDDSVKNQIGGTAQTQAPYRFGNAKKDWWQVADNQNYILAAVEDISVDFGFNSEQNLGLSNRTIFVVDPLNPQFPQEASIGGKIGGVRIQLGIHKIDWNGYVHDGNFYLNERQLGVRIRPGNNYGVEHYVRLVNLDRHDFQFLVSDTTYTGDNPQMIGNLYNISERVYLDPIAASVYDQTKNEYKLPRELTLRFTAASADPVVRLAQDLYGMEFKLTETRWWLGNSGDGIRVIELKGNGATPWPMVLNTARASGKTGSFEIPILKKSETKAENPFGTKLTIKNRSVTKTNIGSKVNNVFTADDRYAIDPYNVASSLPTSIQLTLGNEGDLITNSAPVWTYNPADITTLMIEGIGDNRFIGVKLKLYAETLLINFPVKARKLANVGMIDAGTFYINLDSAEKILDQLPKGLYFNFAGESGGSDWSFVPWKINVTLPTVPQVGVTYTLSGTFGITSNTNNLTIRIVAVRPRLYTLADVKEENGILTSYKRLDYYYSTIPVPVNSNGINLGTTTVKNMLPNYLWLGNGVNPIKIVSKEFKNNAQNVPMSMELKASYSFVSSGDVNPYVAMNADNSKMSTIQYSLPTSNELTTELFDRPQMDTTKAAEDGMYHFTLGMPIAGDSMPKAVYAGKYYSIFWQFNNVDINRCGSYSVMGTLVVSDEKIYTFEVWIYVDPIQVQKSEINIDSGSLGYSYSGKEKEFKVSLPKITGTDGTQVEPSYNLSYALDDGSANPIFVKQQFLDAGKYILRVTVDDINAVGAKDFKFEITKLVISGLQWSTNNVFIYKDGTPQSPTVQNLPDWVIREMKYFEIDSNDDKIPLASVPINAGKYEVKLSIPNQNNCTISGEELKGLAYSIGKKNPVYVMENSLTYNGAYRHVPVNGLPAILENGMNVKYVYYMWVNDVPQYIGTDMVRNVGKYSVEITVDGGRNYESNSNIQGNFTIGKETLTVTVGKVESYYLKSILPFTSNVKYSAPVGNDTLQNFSKLELFADVTERSIPGEYAFSVIPGSLTYSLNGVVYDNYNINYQIVGGYQIKINEGVKLIANKGELGEELAKLKPGNSVSYFLEAGDYGDIVLSVNADVTLTGCYRETEGEKDEIAVTANSIYVQKGSAKFSIMKFKPKQKTISVRVGYNAGNVSVADCEFAGADALTIPSVSNAVYAERGYKATVSIENTDIYAYEIGISIESGKLVLVDSALSSCTYGAMIQSGSLQVARTLFSHMPQFALCINGTEGSVSVAGCRFQFNVIAVKYSRPLLASELDELLQQGENVYSNNGQTVIRG